MRRPDNEPLLFDLPLDRPARDDEAEPVLERQPQRAPRSPQTSQAQQPSPRRPSPATGKTATAREGASPPASRLPLASAAALSARLAPPAATLEDPSLRRPRDLRSEPAEPAAWPERAESAGPASRDRKRGAPAASDTAGLPVGSAQAGASRRLAAGAADLLVHVAVAVLALAGCRYLGVSPALADWPALGVFLLSFSFLYTVVPLAFWGHTLGMSWARLTAESADGEPMSFDQTARHWFGALVTLAALGLPLLLALTGRSLSDRLSGSRTLAT
jgi:uncharacterized RDD family membrane protein YckC